MRSDGLKNVDLSVFKNFAISEGIIAALRVEFFNFFNTPQFAEPNSNFGTGSFGTVTSQENIPRQIQLGMRITF